MASPDHRRLAAIMFTDMVGYSALAQRDETLALRLLEEHRAIIRHLLAAHGGREVKTTGDGFLLEFQSALAAVNAAVEIQQAFHERNETCPPGSQVRLRIGIHLGDVVFGDGDIHGDGVNIAARLEPLAPAGGICVSEDVQRAIRNKVAHSLVTLGSAALKHIDLPVEVFRVVLPWEQSADAPAATAPAAARSSPEKSVAVLAFADLSADRTNEYFSDGVSEELINVLAKIPALKVSARTSAFSFKGKQVPIADIARQLGVTYVVEGSVRKSGDRLRITAQLINASDGFHVWSENFDRQATDIFALQDEIAALIAQNLQLKMAMPREHAVVHPEAHRLLLQGRYFAQRLNAAGWHQSLVYFREAISLAPEFARAWADLARSHILLARYEGMPAKEGFAEARRAAEAALRLEPGLPQGLDALGWVQRTADWDWLGAEKSFRAALAAEPQNAGFLGDLAVLLGNQGRLDEAIPLARRATELDPLNAEVLNYLSVMLWSAPGHQEEGERCMRKAIELAPGAAEFHKILCVYLVHVGRIDDAAECAAREPSERYRLFSLALLAHRRGDSAAARAALEELVARFADDVPFHVATLHAEMNQPDEAFAWIDRAVATGDAGLAWIRHVPMFSNLQSDPRWAALMEKLHLKRSDAKVAGGVH